MVELVVSWFTAQFLLVRFIGLRYSAVMIILDCQGKVAGVFFSAEARWIL